MNIGLNHSLSIGSSKLSVEAATIIARVQADGGHVEDPNYLNALILDSKNNNYYDDIIAAWSPSWGVKGTTNASLLYSLTGAGSDLPQVVGANQPAISLADLNGKTRLTLDGINHFMRDGFTLTQPETIFIGGFQQVSYSSVSYIFDGNGVNNAMAMFQNGVSPTLQVYAGDFAGDNTDAVVGSDFTIRVLIKNGAGNSEIQVYPNAATNSGNVGAADGDGISIGTNGTAGGSFSNQKFGAYVVLGNDPAVDPDYYTKATALANFLDSAYGL